MTVFEGGSEISYVNINGLQKLCIKPLFPQKLHLVPEKLMASIENIVEDVAFPCYTLSAPKPAPFTTFLHFMLLG